MLGLQRAARAEKKAAADRPAKLAKAPPNRNPPEARGAPAYVPQTPAQKKALEDEAAAQIKAAEEAAGGALPPTGVDGTRAMMNLMTRKGSCKHFGRKSHGASCLSMSVKLLSLCSLL